MKILLIILLCFFSPYFNKKNNQSFYSECYCLIDGYNGEILEGSNYYRKRSVASVSKIMTAIIAIESNHLFDVITVDETIYKIEGSSLYLSIGDQITIVDLVYGLLLRSGNDASVLIEKHLSSYEGHFVSMMNYKANELGMKYTIFNNPNGLDIYDEGNISCAYDICLLMKYCMGNEVFREIISTKKYKNNIKGLWKNKNRLLFDYKFCIGGKTGYTKKAKRTLVTASEKDQQMLILCTLNCSSDFEFHKKKYEEYFNAYDYYVCLYKGVNFIDGYNIYSDKQIGIRVKKNSYQKILVIIHLDTETKFIDVEYQVY